MARTGVAKGVSGAISVTTQVAIAAGVISMSGALGPEVVRVPKQSLRYVNAVFLPPAPVAIERPAPAEPVKTAPRKVEMPEPAPERPALVAVREFENRVTPTPAATEIRPIEPSVRPTPEPPKPVVGAFASPAAIARVPEPARRIERAGFDAPVAISPQSQAGTTSVGAFSRPTATAATQPTRIIRETSFGSASSAERPKTHHLVATTAAGFTDARVVQPAPRIEHAPQAPSVVPVEVLSKPTPAYSDLARLLKIEGEVVLEVEFLATGTVRVVRVVRGLGYGLDESAKAAAQDIRFRPATSAGRAVDSRTTVQIVFRLA